MRKIGIILGILSLIAGSCGQKAKKQMETINEGKQNVSDILLIQFDWDKVIALKNNTIEKLKKKEKSEDKIIMNFLNEYRKFADEFSEILFNNKDYDKFNDSIYDYYKNGSKVYVRYLEFKSEVEANGFSIAYPEGMICIVQNTNFIKSGILPLVNSISTEFINLYSYEIDSLCCDDAAIQISTEEIVNRVYKWGELSKKVAELEYKNHVEEEFYSNLYLLFFGLDNTPAFDWETKKYNHKAIDLMNKIIKKNPTSRAAEEFIPFIKLLENENFEETQNVKDYWKKIRNF